MDEKKDKQQQLFRKKALDRISTPDQLTDYLRVTNPGVWAVLIVVIVLLAGIIVWASVGKLETTMEAKAIVSNGSAEVIGMGSDRLESGMPLRIMKEEYEIDSTDEDVYGRSIGHANVSLADGTYDAVVVTEETRPIEFLLKSNY